MPKFKKMYSNLENPHIQKMMKCIKIQDKTTLVNRCCDYALKKMLPIYQKHYPNDDRPLQAINAAKNRLEGKIQLPEAKKSILACHESARNTENNPPAQAAARAIGQAASSIHVTAHALGIAFYGAMAVAYDTATNETQATYDKLAEVELANIEQSLRAICVGNEPHFMPNIYSPNQTTYQQAKKLLENNELVVFPTETIYGLGANALSDEAAKKIFQLKGRPNDNPLIVHLGDKKQIPDYAEIENEIQQTIIDKLMPGPITLLLKKKKQATRLISSIVCPVKYVGIRFPSNQIAQEFLQTVKLPIAAPSANLSGKPSPTNAKMVYDNLGDKVPMIIDGGESEAGIESTVVRVTPLQKGDLCVQILRPGFVTKEDIEELFNHEVTVEYTTNNPELSPGMRYKHYSISGKVVVLNNPLSANNPSSASSSFQSSSLPLPSQGDKNKEFPVFLPPARGVGEAGGANKIGYLITQEFFDTHQTFFSTLQPQNNTFIKIRGTHKNLAICAHNLFEFYHYFDQEGVDILYVEQLPEIGIGYSIMNRVKKSTETA